MGLVIEASSRGGGRSAWMFIIFCISKVGTVSDVSNVSDIDMEEKDGVFGRCAFHSM